MRHTVKIIDGQQIGNWTVVHADSGRRSKSGQILCACRCICGRERLVLIDNLRRNLTTSCCCQRKTYRPMTHGMSKTPEYRIWAGMIARCKADNDRSGRYAKRGIGVCERWSSSFQNFLQDVGKRPGPQFSLDRIDNDGDYEPGNVRWATTQLQARNRSSNTFLEIRGEKRLLVEWCELYRMPINTVLSRLERGWSTELAVSLPAHRRAQCA